MKPVSGPVTLPAMLMSLVLWLPTPSVADEAISLGIFPYLNASQLVQHHQPLKRYLQQRLEKTIHMSSRSDFPTFVRATREREFDLVLTAPHLGRLAQLESGYVPIAQTDHNVQAFFVTHKNSGIDTLADLTNRTISMMPSHALIIQMAEKQLKSIGLENGKNILIKRTRTHNNALFTALNLETDAAVTGIVMWRSLSPELKSEMRILSKTREGPGIFLMAHPHWTTPSIDRVREIVLEFSDSPLSRDYRYNGFIRVSEKTLQQLDPYLPSTTEIDRARHAQKN